MRPEIKYSIEAFVCRHKKNKLMIGADHKPVSKPTGKPVKKVSRYWA